MGFNRTNSNGCPCKGCEDRVPEPRCHMTCERYKAWQAKMGAINEEERRLRNNTMSESKKRALWKSKRYSRQTRNTHKIDTY